MRISKHVEIRSVSSSHSSSMLYLENVLIIPIARLFAGYLRLKAASELEEYE